MRLTKGDAHSLSFATPCTLRSPSPDREARLHLLRLEFRWPPAREISRRKPSGHPKKRFETALRQRLGGLQYFPRCLFEEYYPIAQNILSEMEKPGEVSAWKISALCQVLTTGLLASGSTTDGEPTKFPRRHRQKSASIKRALQYLQENCHEALTLNAIAWKVQLSGQYLARLFKQETGRTVFTWLDAYRTEKARGLLTMTELPLSQIAHACGYSTPKLFIRHFKKNMGLPPIAYRTKSQKGEIFSPSNLISMHSSHPGNVGGDGA